MHVGSRENIIFEYKFLSPIEQRGSLFSLLRHYTSTPKQFSSATLRTTYFDDNKNSSYYESRDGHMNKQKYRFREYLNPEEGGAFYSLEIKIRNAAQTSKAKRLIYKKMSVGYVPTTFNALIPYCEELQGEFFADLRSAMPDATLLPDTMICYERFRFDDYHENVRYNLDTKVKVFPNANSGNEHENGFFLGHDIFEIKSGNPDFFPHFLDGVGLERISMSKFLWGKEEVAGGSLS